MKYEPVIGIEVHAELQTVSKMFCGCPVVDSTQAAPNTAVCPVCAGMPGTLPVLNQKAVEFGLRVALALECEIQHTSIFARKNYFYPDLPKGYQISQYEQPLAVNGKLHHPHPAGREGHPHPARAPGRGHRQADPRPARRAGVLAGGPEPRRRAAARDRHRAGLALGGGCAPRRAKPCAGCCARSA